MITLPRLLTPRRTRRGPAPPSAPIKAPKCVHPPHPSISGISRECPSVSSDPPALDSRRRSDGLTYPFTDLFTFTSSPLQHPCGADKYVAREEYKTCALTETAIMAFDAYKTAEHVVPCPSAVCETKCTASGAASGFHCFNTSVLMDSTALEANERGLAMGCLGSHPMGNMGMHMAGAGHGDCLVGHNHNDYMATGGAATSFSSVVVAIVVALAAFALA